MAAAAVPVRAPAGSFWRASPGRYRLSTDAHLVTLTRLSRPGAFEAVYDRHHRAIYGFCVHLLGDRHEAEDALQQTFLSAYNALLASEQPIHLRPWLFTIARH